MYACMYIDIVGSTPTWKEGKLVEVSLSLLPYNLSSFLMAEEEYGFCTMRGRKRHLCLIK